MKNNSIIPKITINNSNNIEIPFKVEEYVIDICKILSLEIQHIEITLLAPKIIQKMNSEHFSVDSPTDTISFNLSQNSDIFGDIYLCPFVINKNASLYKETFEKEFKIVIIHSILHLIGYTDNDSKSKKEMTDKQNKIYQQLITNDT